MDLDSGKQSAKWALCSSTLMVVYRLAAPLLDIAERDTWWAQLASFHHYPALRALLFDTADEARVFIELMRSNASDNEWGDVQPVRAFGALDPNEDRYGT